MDLQSLNRVLKSLLSQSFSKDFVDPGSHLKKMFDLDFDRCFKLCSKRFLCIVQVDRKTGSREPQMGLGRAAPRRLASISPLAGCSAGDCFSYCCGRAQWPLRWLCSAELHLSTCIGRAGVRESCREVNRKGPSLCHGSCEAI